MSKSKKPKFIIQEKAWNTMQQFAGIAHKEDGNEISGLIPYKMVEHPVSGERVYELFDPVILEQVNSATTTELDGEAIRDYQIKAGMKHGTNIKFCWWHSHHTMDAFWSGTDQNEIDAWENDSWSLALVVNLFGEYKLNVSVWQPIQYSEDVNLEIIRNIAKPTKKQMKEYEELCSSKTAIVSSGWKHTTYGAQTAMWKQTTKKEDALDVDANDKLGWKNGESINKYSRVINTLDEAIDDLIGNFCEGKIDYDEYSKTIDKMNKDLKQLNAKVSVKKLNQGTVLEKSMTMQSWEHVKYESEKIEQIYDDARVLNYNHGWGYGGYLA